MDCDEHVEAGEQCFGSRFCWPGVACAFVNWPCIGKLFFFPNLSLLVAQSSICNGNRTEWSPIRSLIIRVITKSDDCAAGVRFVYHEYDYGPNWTTRSPIAN